MLGQVVYIPIKYAHIEHKSHHAILFSPINPQATKNTFNIIVVLWLTKLAELFE